MSLKKDLEDLTEGLAEAATAAPLELVAGQGQPIPAWVYEEIDRLEKQREARQRWRERNPDKYRERLERNKRQRAQKKAEAALADQTKAK